MDSFTRMANLTSDQGGCDDMGRRADSPDASLRNIAKRATNISLPGIAAANTRSLFIFSDENFIRKYAKLIIEWGYPLLCYYRREPVVDPVNTWCSCVCLFIVVLVNSLHLRVHAIVREARTLCEFWKHTHMTHAWPGLTFASMALPYWSTNESCNINVAMRLCIQESKQRRNTLYPFPKI